MFKALKYKVVLLQNLTAAQIVEAFQLVAESMMLSSLPQETQEFWRMQGHSGTVANILNLSSGIVVRAIN